MKKVKGGALLYSLFIVLVVGVLLSVVLNLTYFSKANYIRFSKVNHTRWNADSGLQLLLSNTPPLELNEEKILDLFGEETDSVELKRLGWGMFEVITSKGIYKGKTSNRAALIGTKTESNLALYLTDRNRPLSLAGKTEVRGNCKLPKKGVKRAYIEGTSYTGNRMIYGDYSTSDKQLPKYNAALVEAINNRFSEQNTDSVVAIEMLPDSLNHPFLEKTIVAYSSSHIVIENQYLSGNIIVRSDKSITVRNSSVLENVMLFAPMVYFENQFEGTVQAFTTDSLVVEEDVQLKYPSALCLIQERKSEWVHFISVGERTQLSGAIFMLQKEYDFRKPIRLNLAKETEVTGDIYLNGTIEHQGSIFGSLYCYQFTLKTPGSVYENHLLNAVISNKERPELFVGANLLESKKGKRTIIEWLN